MNVLTDEQLIDAFYKDSAPLGDKILPGLRAVAEAAIAADRAARAEPVLYQYKFSGMYGYVWRASPAEWNGLKPVETRALYTAPPAPPAAPVVPEGLLNEAEMVALRRFAETTEDEGSYDIGHRMVRRLCDIGALSWRGHRRYQTTDFGDAMLAVAPAPKE